MIDFPDGVTAENSGYYPNMGWSFPNQMLSYVWEGNEVNLWEETQKFVELAEVSPVLGFAFDDTGVKRMNRTLNEIAEKYSSGLESGLSGSGSLSEKNAGRDEGGGFRSRSGRSCRDSMKPGRRISSETFDGR